MPVTRANKTMGICREKETDIEGDVLQIFSIHVL